MLARDTISRIFRQLAEWKELPNYQAERRIDIFFGYYLDQILFRAGYVEGKAYILPEFPLKKADCNRSNKIDYLVTDGKQLLAVELKTDMDSIAERQLQYYARFCRMPWGKIKDEIGQIANASRSSKYDTLIRSLCGEGWSSLADGVVGTVVYIQPCHEADEQFPVISFDDIIANGLEPDGVSDLFISCLSSLETAPKI